MWRIQASSFTQDLELENDRELLPGVSLKKWRQAPSAKILLPNSQTIIVPADQKISDLGKPVSLAAEEENWQVTSITDVPNRPRMTIMLPARFQLLRADAVLLPSLDPEITVEETARITLCELSGEGNDENTSVTPCNDTIA